MSTKKTEKRVPIRKKTVLPLKVKIEMLDRLRLGESFASISRSFNVNESTVRSIKKSEDKIRSSAGSNFLSAKIVRDPAIEKMEVALSLWIEDCNQKRVPLSGPTVREKAKRLYAHFKEPGQCSEGGFQASEGWLNKFKMRQSLHNMNVVWERASSGTDTVRRYPEELARAIADGGYGADQVFNADETGLFWRRMPKKTSICKSEKCSPGLNDRVTIVLCCNASGDCVIKPLMLYKSFNPRGLKNEDKDDLPVFWRANTKSWVTSGIFCEWFRNCFTTEVETYLKKKNLDFKALLVLDTAPAHPRELQNMHPNIQVMFLPPNTTALLQPMDQGIIQTFKLYYIRRTFKMISDYIETNPDGNIMEFWKKFDMGKCIAFVKESLEELETHTLRSSWRKLCPGLTPDTNDEEPQRVRIMAGNIAKMANGIGRDGFERIQSKDVEELVESKDEGLSESDLEEMLTPEPVEEEQQASTSAGNAGMSVKNLSECLRMANELCDFVMKVDPSVERSLIFRREIGNATVPYQLELEEVLKSARQEKIRQWFEQFFKH